jgi:transposase-like protein
MSKRKSYSAQFKFQLVLECLNGTRSEAELARAYEVHPITLGKWKKHFLDHGSEVFGGKEEVKRSEKRQAQLERVLGQKEVEIALLRNFLGNA